MKKKRKQKQIRVWCGFSDGKPFTDRFTDDKYVGDFAIYKTRKAARQAFEDVRPVILIYDQDYP